LHCVDSQAHRGIALHFPIIAEYSDISLLRLLVRGYCHTSPYLVCKNSKRHVKRVSI